MGTLKISITEYDRDTGYGKVCVIFDETGKEWKDTQHENFASFEKAIEWILSAYEHKDDDMVDEPEEVYQPRGRVEAIMDRGMITREDKI